MDQEFIDAITRMTKEQGASVLVDGTWKKWLADYTGSQYPKETALLKRILNAKCAEYINDAQNVPERKQAVLVKLEDDENLSPKKSAEYLDLLGLLLKGDTSKCGAPIPQTAQKISTPAAPVVAPSQNPSTPNGVVPDVMVQIPSGTFMMGSPASEPKRYDNETSQQVTVSGFYMGKYPVTQAEWQVVMGNNPSHFKGKDLPVENVRWYDAIEYCNKRSQREGLNPAYTISGTNVSWNRSTNGYRLPTEAEWEYACRAGTTTPYSSGRTVDNAGWYYENSGNKTHPVGEKEANAWGLYDMHGNVWEWCWDLYDDYSSGAQTDLVGASSGSDRVYRGGCWASWAGYVRSACRGSNPPSDRHRSVGFRLARP